MKKHLAETKNHSQAISTVSSKFFMLKRNAKKGDGGHYAIHVQLFLRNQLLNDNWLMKNITYYLIFWQSLFLVLIKL